MFAKKNRHQTKPHIFLSHARSEPVWSGNISQRGSFWWHQARAAWVALWSLSVLSDRRGARAACHGAGCGWEMCRKSTSTIRYHAASCRKFKIVCAVCMWLSLFGWESLCVFQRETTGVVEEEHQGSEVANKNYPLLADCLLNTELSTRGQREEAIQREMSQLNCRHPQQLQ